MEANDGYNVMVSNLRRTLTNEFGLELEFNTIENTKRTVVEIQDKQVATYELRDMSRIRAFLDKLESLEARIERDDKESCSDLGLIWLSVKNILETASAHPTSFSDLLEAFKDLGHALPSFDSSHAYETNHALVQRLLILILNEVSNFLFEVMRLVTYYSWHRLFRPLWNEFRCSHQKHIVDRIRKFANALNEYCTTGIMTIHLDSLLMDLRYDEARRSRDEQSRRDNMMVDVRSWINATSQEGFHEHTASVYYDSPASGQWILENKQVKEWIFDEIPSNPLLWIHAIPGAGKTVLASKIIDRCRTQDQSHTAYFYCMHDDRAAIIPLAIYRVVLSQIMHQFPSLSAYFDYERRQHPGPHLVSEKRAQQLLEILAHLSSRQYIIIDGLDECESNHRKIILKFLLSLVQNVDRVKPGCLRLLIVSRNEPDIQQYMNVGHSLGLTAEDNEADIGLYVAMWLKEIQGKFEISNQAVHLLQKRICLRTNGQFLFAKLLLENLFQQSNRKRFVQEIGEEKLPEGLPEMYDRILARIQETLKEDEWESAKRFIGWMTCAKRPLKWWEIQGAMSIDLDKMVVDYEERQSRRHVRELCGSLVYEHAGRVRLVHSTAKRYIIESKYIDSATVNCLLTRLCLQYLAFDCFFDYQPETDGNEYLLAGYFAFTEYASIEWPSHLEQIVEENQKSDDSSEDLLESEEFSWLCEAATELVLRHTEDFPPGCEQGFPNNAKMLPSFILDKLGQHNRDHVESFKALWLHMITHRHNFSTNSRQISLLRVEDTVTSLRKATEQLISPKATSVSTRESLTRKYGPKLYKCSKAACHYFHEGFTDPTYRDRHERMHNRRFQCHESQCTLSEFGFASQFDLKRHIESFHADADIKMTLYNELKPKPVSGRKWECLKCNKSFVRNGILKSHLLTHEGKRPHECSHCGQAFVRKNDRNRHEKGHENESTHIAKRRRVQDPRYDRVQIMGDNNRVHLGDINLRSVDSSQNTSDEWMDEQAG